MTTYTLHVPRDARPGDPTGLDRAQLVKDGFAWGAFFFSVLWFFFHRLWLAGSAILIVEIAFGAAIGLLNVHPAAASAAHLLLAFLIGLEANSLRRWTLARRGLPAVDVVTASSQSEAETKLFTRWLDRQPQPGRQPPAAPAMPARSEPVIGLFPDAENSR